MDATVHLQEDIAERSSGVKKGSNVVQQDKVMTEKEFGASEETADRATDCASHMLAFGTDGQTVMSPGFISKTRNVSFVTFPQTFTESFRDQN